MITYSFCPANWVEFADESKCFYFNSDSVTFQEAVGICRTYNATLPSVHSLVENNFLKYWAFTVNSHDYLWLGGIDSGNFTWIDGTAMDFTNWDDNQPDHNNCNGECNIEMRPDGKWHDYKSSQVIEYVCQKHNEPTPIQSITHSAEAHLVTSTTSSNPVTTDKFLVKVLSQLKVLKKVMSEMNKTDEIDETVHHNLVNIDKINDNLLTINKSFGSLGQNLSRNMNATMFLVNEQKSLNDRISDLKNMLQEMKKQNMDVKMERQTEKETRFSDYYAKLLKKLDVLRNSTSIELTANRRELGSIKDTKKSLNSNLKQLNLLLGVVIVFVLSVTVVLALLKAKQWNNSKPKLGLPDMIHT